MICSNRQHNKSSRQQGLGFPAYWEAHGEFQCEESGKVAVDGIIAAFRHILTGRKKGPPPEFNQKNMVCYSQQWPLFPYCFVSTKGCMTNEQKD